jgi:GDSL-like Lipase/Acylhydrolase family
VGRVNIILIILGILVGIFALLEGGLRYVGFGNPLLYKADDEIGYLLTPNQQVRRMNNRISINQYSMRSDGLDGKLSENTLRIFLIGDSIANGGWWTDQSETISSLLQQQFNNSKFSQVEVLNASANSWGPRNQLAYLKRYGLFNSQVVILLLNTEDFFSGVPSSEAVGRDFNYPERKPMLAVIELLNRYIPNSKNTVDSIKKPREKDVVSINLEAIKEIQAICRDNNTQLLIALTPLLSEVEHSPREFQQRAKNRLFELVKQESIPFIDFLPHFKKVQSPSSIYRDRIHITPEGNKIVSQVLNEQLENRLLREEFRKLAF